MPICILINPFLEIIVKMILCICCGSIVPLVQSGIFCCSLLSELAAFGARFFLGVATFGDQQMLYKVGATELYLRNKRRKLVKTVL